MILCFDDREYYLINYDDIDVLVSSVNVERLKNFPISLTKEDIKEIYLEIFNKIERR